MTGAVWQQKVAAFQVIPFVARRKIPLPSGIQAILDTSKAGIKEIEKLPEPDNKPSRDYLLDKVKLQGSDQEDSDSDSDPEEEGDNNNSSDSD